MKESAERLLEWQAKVNKAKTRQKNTREQMDYREKMYKGEQYLRPVTDSQEEAMGRGTVPARHVFNVIAENIESEIDVNIPQPKVTAVRPEDEPLAKIIEDFIRSELDRMQFEEMNDMQERIVPIQGGGFWIVGWDNGKRTHTTVGEVYVQVRHPKQVIPQHGVYSDIEDMEFIALEIPKTKEDIKRRYGIDVSDEGEETPEVKSSDEADSPTDMVTQVIVYYRNSEGGIGRYSYVGDTELENISDWNARRRKKCAKCGAPEESNVSPIDIPTQDGNYPTEAFFEAEAPDNGAYTKAPQRKRKAGQCPYCGGNKWEYTSDEYRTFSTDYKTQGTGKVLPAFETSFDEFGAEAGFEQVMYPYYKPDIYPVVLQRNISVFGELLGESDVDKIADQQNIMNQVNKAIIDRIFRAGTKISLPPDVEIVTDPQNGEVIRLDSPDQAAMINTYDFTGDLSTQLAYRALVYEEPRQILGITDSLQGRKDATATSAVAKEFSAQQSAGRLESKRRLKNAAYARIFELIFKTALANMDEPRPIRRRENGDTIYTVFDPMDFYEQDDAGQWYVNDRFLFSTDSAAPLASNREAMWQEITAQYEKGAYGDPASDETRLLYWRQMEELHYPLAAAASREIKNRIERMQATSLRESIAQDVVGAGSDMSLQQAQMNGGKALDSSGGY